MAEIDLLFLLLLISCRTITYRNPLCYNQTFDHNYLISNNIKHNRVKFCYIMTILKQKVLLIRIKTNV
jgi:hypothetical protein